MEEVKEKNDVPEKNKRDEPISKVIRAGKRTYFFDVKSTQRNDFYLTLTESKKKYNRDGRFIYEKHLIYLYKEDFKVFLEGLTEMINHVQSMHPVVKPNQRLPKTVFQEEEIVPRNSVIDYEEAVVENYTNVNFDDLDDKEIH